MKAKLILDQRYYQIKTILSWMVIMTSILVIQLIDLFQDKYVRWPMLLFIFLAYVTAMYFVEKRQEKYLRGTVEFLPDAIIIRNDDQVKSYSLKDYQCELHNTSSLPEEYAIDYFNSLLAKFKKNYITLKQGEEVVEIYFLVESYHQLKQFQLLPYAKSGN